MLSKILLLALASRDLSEAEKKITVVFIAHQKKRVDGTKKYP